MPKLLLTYDIAHRAGWDAGNNAMRKGGRSVWNEDDYNVCAREMSRLIDIVEGIEEDA